MFLRFLPIDGARISHVGSTAIHGILLEIPLSASMETVKSKLIDNGYFCMSEADGRKSFNKGYTSEGFAEKVFHLHLRYFGDNDELYFRDHLNNHPEVAKEYEDMQLLLCKQYKHSRDAYTEAKGDFIKECTMKVKEEYDNRYA